MINGIRLKVCGITSLVDADAADAVGADCLGFIFHAKSPRHVSPTQYAAMRDRLPPRKRVAVCVEPAVADGVCVHPCAIRYQHADGTLCRAVAYVGDLSFMQSLGLTIRQRGVVVRLRFGPAVETARSSRRDVAAATRAQVASLLGLSPQDTPPRTPDGRSSAPP